MENAELVMRLKESKGESTASGKRARPSESDSRISHFAKLFGVMHEPFVPLSALLVARPDTTSSSHSGRYESELSKVRGITTELYEVLPKDLHKELEMSTKFRSTV